MVLQAYTDNSNHSGGKNQVKINIDHESTIALHVQLLNQLRHLILSGEAPPGSRLPSESEFQRDLKISRSTIRQALSNAEAEGLIERVPGKGSFVRRSPIDRMRSNFIGYITFEFHSEFQGQLLRGAESVTRAQGYRIIFCNSNRDTKEEDRLIDQLIDDKVRGILIWPAWNTDRSRRLFQLAAQNTIPIVLMDRTFEGLNCDYVISDNYSGAYEAVQHLIGLGHRDIIFLSRPILQLLPIAERLRGYRQAMLDAGITPLDPWLVGTADEETGYLVNGNNSRSVEQEIEQIVEYFRKFNDVTAIFAMNDLVALQALKAARKQGKKVPDELSIVGFDDMDIVSYFEIPLTTVSQDIFYIGKRAAELLIERIKGYQGPCRKEVIPTQLQIRSTTSRPSLIKKG